MNKTIRWVLVVIGILLVLVLGLSFFYKSSLLVNDFGESVRRPFDVVIQKISKGNYPKRVVFNTEESLEEDRDWPYYFYAKVKVAGQPYYDEGEILAANEWFLVIEDYQGKEHVVHSFFGTSIEGIEHPVVGNNKSFAVILDMEEMFETDDIVKIYIDKADIEEAKYDEKIVPLAIFVEERK